MRCAAVVAANTVVYVKFHQVGGTSAQYVMRRMIDKQATEAHQVATSIYSHETVLKPGPLEAQARWAQHGLPNLTFATTVLRHPVDKLLSNFFKHQFPSVLDPSGRLDHYTPHQRFDRLFGVGTERNLTDMLNLSKVSEAIKILTSSPARNRDIEYTDVMGHSTTTAIHLLRQFAVVGITERFDDWAQDVRMALGDLALREDQVSRRPTNTSYRASVGHLRMADLPAADVEKLTSYVQQDMPIYEEARRLAARGPRQVIQY